MSERIRAKCRDYTFDEWSALTPEVKRELMRSWDPRRPEIGERTRWAVVEAFGATHPTVVNHGLVTTGYFSNWGWCIVVVVERQSVNVPRRFDVFPVVKGIGADSGADAVRPVRWINRPRV